MKKKVDGHQDIYRDDDGTIVNRNTSDRQRYRIAKQQALQTLESQYELQEIREEVQELSSLKDEVGELKDLLKELLGKK